jgi:MIP family channel proteins
MKMGRRAYTAEFIGTFALVFFGSTSVTVFTAVVGLSSGAATLLGIAFAHGLILMIMVYAIGWISQCHINPAITITAAALRKMDFDDAIGYLIAQVLGAIAGAWTQEIIQPGNGALTHFGAADPGAAIGGDPIMALFIELLITFFLMFSMYAVFYSGKVPAAASGLLIGMTLMVDILIAGPLTGGAANPARALGPAVISGDYSNLWLYWVGPIVGALLAGFVWEYLLIEKKKR